MVGRVLDALENSDHADNTAIVLWSDHGYHLGDKDVWHKFTLWEEAGRAPLIIVDPDAGAPGTVVDQTVSLIDIFPTVLDMLGLPIASRLEGRSLKSLLENPNQDWGGDTFTFMYGSWSVRNDDYRYIHYADGSEELYDLRNDPNQWTNLSNSAEYSDEKAALMERGEPHLAGHGWVIGSDSSATHLLGTESAHILVAAKPVATLSGGGGNDVYFIWDDEQIVTELADGGNDTVFVEQSYTQPLNVEVMRVGRPPLNVPSLTLTGNEQGASIIGSVGNDVIAGLGGDDELNGFWANDLVRGDAGNDLLNGHFGDDWLDGGIGNDVLQGGRDIDTAGFSSALAGVVVNLATGQASDGLGGTDTLSGIENAKGGRFDDILTGNAWVNRFSGADGNDTLYGGRGADMIYGGTGNDWLDGGSDVDLDELRGGAGDDTYVVRAGDMVQELTDSGLDTVQSYADFTLGAHMETLVLLGAATNGVGNALANLIVGTTRANRLDGAGGADRLDGAGGADRLDGAGGADRLQGGLGHDLYVVDNAGDLVIEETESGTDSIESTIDFILPSNVENLTYIGVGFFVGKGNVLVNKMTGGTGNDRLDGGGGRDTLLGEGGDDTYIVENAGVVVSEHANGGTDIVHAGISYVLPGHVENLLLTGAGAISGTGNEQDNVMTGNAAANTLNGGGGNDTLDGGPDGADRLAGASGNDIYIVNRTGLTIIEAANSGADEVKASISFSLSSNVENLTLTGTAAIDGTGNTLDNILTGNNAANALVGGAGSDALRGGFGHDRLTGGSGADVFCLAMWASRNRAPPAMSFSI